VRVKALAQAHLLAEWVYQVPLSSVKNSSNLVKTGAGR
jgi:hypothetical protein